MNINEAVKPEHAFYCADGSVLANIAELAAKLKEIRPDAYAHHANAEKNDFSSWIRDVYGDKALANDIASASDSRQAARMVENRLGRERLRSENTARRAASKKKPPAAKKHSKIKPKTAAATKKAKKKIRKRKAKKKKTGNNHHLRKFHKKLHKHISKLAKKLGLF